jgi:hypothetical protein
MLSGREGQVLRWVIVNQVDVGAETGARIDTLEQIVTEKRILRNAVGERSLEGIDVIDAFSDVTAFVKQILIHVRDGCRVRIDAHVSRKDLGERGTAGAHDVDANPRLQDSVAFRDAAQTVVEPRTVQRMRQRPDETAPSFEREMRVRIQRNDVPHRLKQLEITVQDEVARVRRSTQHAIEFRKLAALAFPAHPESLAWIPAPLAMKVEKAIRTVPRVQVVDALFRVSENGDILRPRWFTRVPKISQQAEVEVGVAIPQKSHFQVVKQRIQPRLGFDNRRDHDDRAIGGWNPVPHGELRQRAWRNLRRDDQIDQADDQLAHRQEHGKRHEPQSRS